MPRLQRAEGRASHRQEQPSHTAAAAATANTMEWAYSLGSRCLSEFAGSLMLYTLAIGGVFNALLPRAKGQGMGLFAIAAGVAGGVGVPTAILYR